MAADGNFEFSGAPSRTRCSAAQFGSELACQCAWRCRPGRNPQERPLNDSSGAEYPGIFCLKTPCPISTDYDIYLKLN
jgi:hypothetical protein